MTTFCTECGSMLSPAAAAAEETLCVDCGGDGGTDRSPSSTDLERLPTTKSGTIRKEHAVEWMESVDRPSGTELKRQILPKPAGFSGSTYAEDISNVRVTGHPEFIEAMAGLLQPFLKMENDETRLEINLRRVEDRETGERTDNYALYLSAAERSGT